MQSGKGQNQRRRGDPLRSLTGNSVEKIEQKAATSSAAAPAATAAESDTLHPPDDTLYPRATVPRPQKSQKTHVDDVPVSAPLPIPVRPARRKSPPELYTARAATPPRDYTNQKSPWTHVYKHVDEITSKLDSANTMIAKLHAANQRYKKVDLESPDEITRLNNELCVPGTYMPMPAGCEPEEPPPCNPPPAPIQSLSKLFEGMLTGDIAGIRENFNVLVQDLRLTKGGRVTDEVRSERLATGIKTLLEYHFGGKRDNKKAEILGNILLSGAVVEKESSNKVVRDIASSVARTVFTPQAICKSIDVSNGSLNDRAVSDMARIEVNENLFNFTKGTSMLPFRGRVTEVRKIMNDFARHLFCFQHNTTPDTAKHGDFVAWDYESLVRFLVKEYGLKEKATSKGGVVLVATGDGATYLGKYSKSQFAAGFKMVDEDAIDPITKEHIFYDLEEGENGVQRKVFKNYQKIDHVAIAAISIKGETKKLLKEMFGPFFAFNKKISVTGLAERGDQPRLLPFKLLISGDMCFLQKITATGGACKVKRFFCLYCECNGSDTNDGDMHHVVTGKGSYTEDDYDLHTKPGSSLNICVLCAYNGRKECGHRIILDKKEIARKTVELKDMLLEDARRTRNDPNIQLQDLLPSQPVRCLDGYENEKTKWRMVSLKDTISADGTMTLPLWEYLRHVHHQEESNDILKDSKVHYHPRASGKEKNVLNIDFVLGRSCKQDGIFMSNVRMGLRKRGYGDGLNNPRPDTDTEQVALLRERLIIGGVVRRNKNALMIDEEAKATRYASPGICVLCHLHAQNREGEKILSELLLAGMRQLEPGKLPWFVAEVEMAVNEHILNRSTIHSGDDGQWSFPLDDARKKLKAVNLSNPVAQKFVAKLEKLYECCLVRYSDKTTHQWREMIKNYRRMHKKLGSHAEFEFKDICEYQLAADQWLDDWTPLTGRPGESNYVHLHRAGHWSWFLWEFGNVYKYSQQGYENVNGVMKSDFHSKTQKGGGRGGTSKLEPILLKQGRRLLWRFGYGNGLFEKLGYKLGGDVEFNKIPKMPRHKDMDTQDLRDFSDIIMALGSPDDTGVGS